MPVFVNLRVSHSNFNLRNFSRYFNEPFQFLLYSSYNLRCNTELSILFVLRFKNNIYKAKKELKEKSERFRLIKSSSDDL